MIEELHSHQTDMELLQTAPARVDAGTDIVLKVKVSCPSACDLRGSMVRVLAQDGNVILEEALTSFEEATCETDAFTVKVPVELGDYAWSVVFPAQEVAGVLHEESSTPVLFNVKPHSTSMTVWDIPSPIPFRSKFPIKVGVKCSAACSLVDQKIDIYDQQGTKVATAVLGSAPWPGTSALYWAEVELEAPDTEGCYKWEVRFPKPEVDLPHEGASYAFIFTTASAPEHFVTVEVVDQRTGVPIKKALVSLHSRGTPYRKGTDDSGVAQINIPKGEYVLYVVKPDYRPFRTTVKVNEDVKVKAELMFFLPWGQA